MALDHIDGVLLDIDGVLSISWEPIPGSIDAVAWLRQARIPFRLITNTTTHTRADMAATLRDAGFDVAPAEIVTAVVATASYLREHHPGEHTVGNSNRGHHREFAATFAQIARDHNREAETAEQNAE